MRSQRLGQELLQQRTGGDFAVHSPRRWHTDPVTQTLGAARRVKGSPQVRTPSVHSHTHTTAWVGGETMFPKAHGVADSRGLAGATLFEFDTPRALEAILSAATVLIGWQPEVMGANSSPSTLGAHQTLAGL